MLQSFGFINVLFVGPEHPKNSNMVTAEDEFLTALQNESRHKTAG